MFNQRMNGKWDADTIIREKKGKLRRNIDNTSHYYEGTVAAAEYGTMPKRANSSLLHRTRVASAKK